MVKIVYVTFGLLSYSGAAKQAKLLSENLSGDFSVSFFNIEESNDSEMYHSGSLNICHAPISPVWRFFSFALHISRLWPDLVHLHVLDFPCLLAARVMRRKVILKTTMYGADDFETKSRSRFGWVKLRLINYVLINIALTEQIKNANSRHFPVSRIKVIPNGVEVPYSLPNYRRNLFLIVGVVCERKRTLEGIKFFEANFAAEKDSKLLIIGPYGDDVAEAGQEYFDSCHTFVKRSRCEEDQVEFMGAVNQDDLKKIYSESIALIFLSVKEGMPNVVLEAMAHNCVPILSAIGGMASEMVEHRVTGFVLQVPERECVDLADLQSVYLSNAIPRKIDEKFSISAISRRYNKVYRTVSFQ